MSIKLKDTIYDLINRADKDGSGNTITSTYLKLSGGMLTGDLGIKFGDTDKFIVFDHDGDWTAGASWRIGVKGSGTGNTNYFSLQSGTSTTSTTKWTDIFNIGQNDFVVYFNQTPKVNDIAVSLEGHTHYYAGSSSLGGSALKADQLTTSRTLWGQSFNGKENVSGNMTGVGSISMSSTLTLTGTTSVNARINFSRGSAHDYPYNYITAPTGGIICIEPGGLDCSSSTGYHFSNTAFYPAANNTYSLGTSSSKWSNVYATTFTGSLSGNATSSSSCSGNSATATLASTVICPVTTSDYDRPIVGTPGNNTLYHTTLATVNWNTGKIICGGLQSNRDITLYNASGGDSPHLIFQRGGLYDSTYDWDVFVTSGTLKFRINKSSSTAASYTDILKMYNSDDTIRSTWAIYAPTFKNTDGKEVSYSDHTHSNYYNAGTSRTKNTVLAAPNDKNGVATFRTLVAADIPTLAISKISGLQTALDGKSNTDHIHTTYLPLSGGTMTGNIKVYTDGDGRGLKFGTSILNSLNNQLLWQSAEAIRFGSSSWDWNSWAGLKYNHSSKIIYLGLADGTIFSANSAQSGGKLYTPGISNIYIGNGSYTVLHSNNWSSYCASASHTHTTIVGNYTANGGQQNPDYFGKNRVGALMMNTSVNGNFHYKDWLFMDCYSGSDVGGSVAIGVNRQALGAYIMRSAADRTSWAESAELLGTHNYTTYCATAGHTHTTYLPLTGGTIQDGKTTGPLNINTTSTAEVGMRFNMSGANKSWVGYHSTYGSVMFNYKSGKYVGLNDSGILHVSGTAVSMSGHNHSAADITSGTLAVARGGTGKTTHNDAMVALIESLSTATATPSDDNYYIAQDTGGTSSYHRRKHSAMYNYIKGKLDSVYSASGHSHSNYILDTGDTMTGTLAINTSTMITTKYSDTNYNILVNHKNGNVSLSSASGGLYLGYTNTSAIYCRGTYVNIDSGNYTTYFTGYYSTTTSRTANTFLAAPNGSAGTASFRKLVAADIPTLAISKISDLQDALDGKSATHSHPYAGSSTQGGAATLAVCSEATSDTNRPILVTNESNGLCYTTKAKLNYSTGIITCGGISTSGTLSFSGVGIIKTTTAQEIQLQYGSDSTKSLVLNSASFKPFVSSTKKLKLGAYNSLWNGLYLPHSNTCLNNVGVNIMDDSGYIISSMGSDGSGIGLYAIGSIYLRGGCKKSISTDTALTSSGTGVVIDASGNVTATTYKNTSGKEVSYSGHTHSYLPLSGGTLTGNLTLMASESHNTDQYIKFKYSSTDLDSYSWRLGYLGTGSGDSNYFVLQSNGGGSWANAIRVGLTTRTVHMGAASGTAPISCDSTTVCTNLNAGLWDGYHLVVGSTGTDANTIYIIT